MNIEIGFKCNNVVVIETGLLEHRYGVNYSASMCKCLLCGKKKIFLNTDLIRGRIKSCGCLKNKKKNDIRWVCQFCGKEFCTRAKKREHTKIEHSDVFNGAPGGTWKKGMKAEDCPSIATASRKLKEGYASGKYKLPWLGKKMPKYAIDKLRVSIKKAHDEHRANTWAMSRCKGGWRISGPEYAFMKILKDIGCDEYVHEFPIGGYSLDFAWIDKKLCIEIDGEQHYQERFRMVNTDNKKDEYLNSIGWKVLRIRWEKEKDDVDVLKKKVEEFINGRFGVIGSIENCEFYGSSSNLEISPNSIHGE